MFLAMLPNFLAMLPNWLTPLPMAVATLLQLFFAMLPMAVATVAMSPRLFELMQKESERRKAEREQKKAEQDAKDRADRLIKSPLSALRSERLARVELTDAEIAELRAAFDAKIVALTQRRAQESRELRESDDAIAFMVKTSPEPLRSTLLRLESQLDSATRTASEAPPEPYKSSLCMQVSVPGIGPPEGEETNAERFTRAVIEHGERVAKASATIDKLKPIVARLRSLCLQASPSEAELADIVAELE
jgi:hypothetical protein